ncbi:MAG TPA: hypothetical protein VE135_26175 [Pyrinomonadaceae bacterium]|nr:hypothetical protein [Pyrinomonadaceae bacterium]
MTAPDHRGHRGAVAGDDYHELWALRESLKLLEPNTDLTTVTVEGLRSEDEKGVPKDTWDGVDCTSYFGGDGEASAERIVIDQVKFSGAKPNQPWTVARLTSATNKKKDNSVIGRLAKAFSGLKKTRADLVSVGRVKIRLVSNQPISPAVIDALSASATDATATKDKKFKEERKVLLKASGLSAGDFDAFARVLDFSECGGDSPLKHEERILLTISSWTEDDARLLVTDLLRFVRNKMSPHEKGEVITRESILARLGVSDIAALFPCPSKIKGVTNFVSREESKTLAARLMNEEQLICLHGEGSCGKTTSLQELSSLLPPDSLTVIFDCFGDGRYLDSDGYRHRPQDAFLQLSNELAQRLRLPLLITRPPELNSPRIFKKRLARAAEVVAASSPDALLVVVVDAADNSITAAATRKPPEKSFVHEFLLLGELPGNVRLLVTSRTGRLPMLSLPHDFALHEIKGFTPEETAIYVRGRLPDVSSSWIEDFHHLSRGVPRVQSYALEFGEGDPDKTLNYLRPNGKTLKQVFAEQLELLRRKVGADTEIKKFCSGLAVLPHPIPIADIAAVTGLSKAHIIDLCNDLSPGIRLEDELIGLADEEFENFVKEEAQQELQTVRRLIADHFSARYKSDAYAATHIAAALLEADRGREILSLINNEKEPTAIRDPILRREAQLQRLKLAMSVCRENGNIVDAMMTMLIGAEALKTDVAIKTMLDENPDLAASFARDTSSRTILRDPDQIENHGSLLFQLIAADGRKGDRISVREGSRQAHAWIERRAESFKEQTQENPDFHPQGWDLSTSDIAASIEAILRIAGPTAAIDELRSWTPRTVALRVGSILPARLIVSGSAQLVEQCLNEIGAPWDLFLLVPLALSGRDVDISRVLDSLAKLHSKGLIVLDRLREPRDDENKSGACLETALTACEIVIARGGDVNTIVPLLHLFADPELRRVDRLSTYQQALIDLSLRAHTLLERINGRKATIDNFLVASPSNDKSAEQAERIQNRSKEQRDELTTFIEPFIPLYDFRAQVLLGGKGSEDNDKELKGAISTSHREDYKLRSDYRISGMREEAALASTRLTMVQTLDTRVLLDRLCDVLEYGSSPFSADAVKVLERLALVASAHDRILAEISARVNAVKAARASSEEKTAALVRFARLLMFLSPSDAESVFTDAINVASEVNAEAIHELALFAPLSRRAVRESGPEIRRAVAHDFAIVASDVAIRLEGQDHFPWTEIAEAVTALDTGFALASIARWEDAGIVDRKTLLPTVLETALRQKTLQPRQVCSLLSLLDEAKEGLIEATASEAKVRQADTDMRALVSDLSREELLRFGKGQRSSVSESLNSMGSMRKTDFWLQRLLQTTEFLSAQKDTERLAQKNSLDEVNQARSDDPFKSINWNEFTFTTSGEINRVVNSVLAAGRASKNYISEETILERIAGVVAPANRAAHLDELRRTASLLIDHDGIVMAILNNLKRWENVPSVATWARENVLAIVTDQLPLLSRWLIYSDSPLPALLARSQRSDADICESLLQGIERHVDSLEPPTIYALVGLAGEYCKANEAMEVMQRYSQRLLGRIAVADRDSWDLLDLPSLPDDALARFLFALLGDADVRIRWRAGYAIRGLARLGDSAVLEKLIRLFADRRVDDVFRRPDAPFYWLAARLWLVITFDRIATEIPTSVKKYSVWLLDIATDEELPHFLIRSFAKSALLKLVGGGHVQLDGQQSQSLQLVNSSTYVRKKRKKGIRKAFHKYQYKARENRRFTFNTTDTLPNWYSDVISGFTDVDAEEFLDIAERWIVDEWGVRNDPWQWNAEPRHDRFRGRSYPAMSHRDGSLPTIERFSTYLEWHAMWCTLGELLRTRPLAKVAKNDYDSFKRELERSDLANPPLWLSDLRGTKPLESRFWNAPKDIDTWLTQVNTEDFLVEIISTNNNIVVDGHHDTRSRGFRLSCRVNTALVSHKTASALVRALQTTNLHRYDVPKEDDEFQINSAPFVFGGWLDGDATYEGIDGRDPLRFDVTGPQCQPGTQASEGLSLEYRLPREVWVQPNSGNEAFVYETWGETGWDDRDDPVRYDDTIRSSGWQLKMDAAGLRDFLAKIKLDLLIEVKLDRHNSGYYDYSRHQEKTKEKTFVRIILFRQNGTIEDAGGRVGAWATSGSRTELG